MKSFKYEVGMTKAEMVERITELLDHMQTDEFWLERGGGTPNKFEGNQLVWKYEELIGVEGRRGDPLWNQFWTVISNNGCKLDVINRTTTNTVKVSMMSGAEFDVSLKNVESINDLMRQAHWPNNAPDDKELGLVDGARVLEMHTRVILTDDSLLTVVIY